MTGIIKKIPRQSLGFLDETGAPCKIWYNFLSDLTNASFGNTTGTGIVVFNGLTSITRSITTGSSKISVVNGDGIDSNIVLDVNQANLTIATTQLTGTLAAAQFPALTGDVTNTAGSLATTLKTVNTNVGSFGSASQVGTFTVNAKGLITAASNTTISGVAPGGSAGGDLSGTYPNPSVIKVNGRDLSTLTAGNATALLALSGTNTGDQTSVTGNAGSATTVAIIDDTSTNATMYPMWVTTTTGNLPPKVSSSKITFNPSNGTLTTTTFSGALSGNATTATSATTATNATNTNIIDDHATNAAMYITWVTTTSGNLPQKVSSTNLTFNPSTGKITAIGFIGALTGNADTVTTNANLTGVITSSGNATSIASQTGTGTKFVVDTSPTLVTPLLGTPTSGTLTNCTGYTEANLSTTDITTNNVSTSKHGFAPKGDGVSTNFLNGTGAYSAPSGSGTVNSGTAGHLAYYATSTNAVSNFAPPTMSAIQNATTTLAANAVTKITFLGTPTWDVGSYFDHATNSRYLPLLAGIYQVNFSIYITNAAVLTPYSPRLYKNGALYKSSSYEEATVANDYIIGGSCLVNLNGSSDYIELFCFNGHATNTATVANSATFTYFDACWVGSLS